MLFFLKFDSHVKMRSVKLYSTYWLKPHISAFIAFLSFILHHNNYTPHCSAYKAWVVTDPQRKKHCGSIGGRFWSTTYPSAVLSMLSQPARGLGSCFGLLLIKPIMSWKVSLHWVCMCVSLTQRGVCALNIRAKSNLINQRHKQVIDPSITQNINRQRYRHSAFGGKASTTAVKGKNYISSSLERLREWHPSTNKCNETQCRIC